MTAAKSHQPSVRSRSCPHGKLRDYDPSYDYPCQCCGQATGSAFLIGGHCERCAATREEAKNDV